MRGSSRPAARARPPGLVLLPWPLSASWKHKSTVVTQKGDQKGSHMLGTTGTWDWGALVPRRRPLVGASGSPDLPPPSGSFSLLLPRVPVVGPPPSSHSSSTDSIFSPSILFLLRISFFLPLVHHGNSALQCGTAAQRKLFHGVECVFLPVGCTEDFVCKKKKSRDGQKTVSARLMATNPVCPSSMVLQ